MANMEIVKTIPEHVLELAENMSADDIEMSKRLGVKANRALWRSFKRSLYCKTMIVEGKILCIWGLCGTLLGSKGYPWLITSSHAEEFPFKIAFVYRKELKEMLQSHPLLIEMADAKHEKSLRLLKLMGFTFEGTVPYGKNGELFIRAEKR